MALDQLNSSIEENRERADQIGKSYLRALDEIKADERLSPQGRIEKVDDLFASSKQALDALRDGEKAILEQRRTSLEKEVFGLSASDPTMIIAYRDATDRANRLETEEQAQRLLDSALLSNDATLAAAVLQRSLEAGFRNVIATYKDAKPSVSEKLSDLSQVTRSLREGSFQRTMAYAIARP